MAYVKNCNPGKITMDLPRANYIYELPLLSFADMYGDFNLSLIFNRQMKDSGEDPFLIQTGYKLNVQKRIIFEDGIPKFLQEENGKCVALYGPDGWPYAFDDDSQRVLRQTGNIASPYMIENADYSREYYNSNGMILSVYDKYGQNGADGTQILSFSYHTNKLATIRYRSSKFVTFVYDEESNLLTTITYTGANCVTSFDYVISSGALRLPFGDGGAFNIYISKPNATDSISPHSHKNVDEVTYIIDGSVYACIDSKITVLNANEAVSMPKEILHTFIPKVLPCEFLTMGIETKTATYSGNWDEDIAKLNELRTQLFNNIDVLETGTSILNYLKSNIMEVRWLAIDILKQCLTNDTDENSSNDIISN